MAYLEPTYAANLASDVYTIKNKKTREVFFDAYGEDFDLGGDESLNATGMTGKTGALFHSEHMMGVAANGKDDGSFKGQAIIAIKGTAGLMDALTDLNAGIRPCSTGGRVHQGFLDCFDSFFLDLQSFVSRISPSVHTVHCVGHSLGGALATLVADWMKANTGKVIKLYTFGSPRVGLEYFSDRAKQRIGDDNIYRVHHKTDPVPMVPTWPFIHLPDGGRGDILLNSGIALAPWEYHKMANYIDSTKPGGVDASWETLRGMRPGSMMENSVEAWLKSDSIISMNLNTARVVSSAILWVIEKAINLAGIAVVIAGSTTFTVLDRLAILLQKASELAKNVSFWVLRLIKRLAQWVGIKFIEGVDITVSFIRAVFLRMHHTISEMVRQAGRIL